ncbi:MAG TPA: hypothetical protein VES59_07625 [Bacteroidota bacterium]|nr:hypothetical protein [Bacteroidota bacterium]
MQNASFFDQRVSRLSFLKQVSVILGLAVSGCSPLRILFKDYPRKFDDDLGLRESALRSFVTTVIPDAAPDEPDLVRIYGDPFYRFHPYCAFFVSDLSRRSSDLFGTEEFNRLAPEQRTAVIENGLDADATIARLYRGAILMAQASYFGGIYDDVKGCPQIDFHGSNPGFTERQMYYPNASVFLASETTIDGNES